MTALDPSYDPFQDPEEFIHTQEAIADFVGTNPKTLRDMLSHPPRVNPIPVYIDHLGRYVSTKTLLRQWMIASRVPAHLKRA